MLSETLQVKMPSNPKMSCLVRKMLSQACEIVGFKEETIRKIVLAVDEAISNVIKHTYKMDFSKKITATFYIEQGKYIKIKLLDSGPPIDLAKIRSREIADVRPGGLGVHFIQSIMDEVEYQPLTTGNVVLMIKYITSQEKKGEGNSRRRPKLLRALLDISQSLHTILDLDEILDLVVSKVVELMDTEGASVILLDEEKNELYFHTVLDEDPELMKGLLGVRFPATHGIAGRVMRKGEPTLITNVEKDPDHFSKIDERTGVKTTSLVYAPLKIRERIIGIVSSKNKKKGEFDETDLDGLTAIAGTVALSIDNARTHAQLDANKESGETQRLRKELHSARIMHKATLPQEIPEIQNVAISATCEPATEVGGDYYDFFLLKKNLYAFTVGDVSGHGLEAGMMVSMARSCLYTQTNFSYDTEDVMDAMNRMVYGSVTRRLIMTFFFGIYDTRSRGFWFSNAGHPSPCYYNAEKDSWQLIEEGEFPLGVFKNHVYKSFTHKFYPNDILILYSDGIIEASNADGKRYGMERFLDLLGSQKWQTANEVQKAILSSVGEFCQKFPATDDRTLLVLKFS